MAQTEAALLAAFSAHDLEIEPEALGLCAEICTEFSMDPGTLAERWDIYSVNNSITDPAGVKHLNNLRSKIAQENKRNPRSVGKENTSRTPVNRQRSGQKAKNLTKESIGSLYGVELMKSPDIKRPMTFQSPDAVASKMQKMNSLFSPAEAIPSPAIGNYETRQGSGRIVEEMNPDLKKRLSTDATTTSSVRIEQIKGDNVPTSFSYMYTPLSERVVALEKQLVTAEELFKANHEGTELGIVGDVSPSTVIVVGRICCEAAEGKLNARVIMLEGSRRLSHGARVLLDVTTVPSYTVFPGKIVAVEGVFDCIDKAMVVKQFLDIRQSPEALPNAMDTQDESEAPLRVVVASGPFTTSENAMFVPLNDLLEVARNDRPNVLILLGPFIDVDHSTFKDGTAVYNDMYMSFNDIFLFKVIAQLDNLLGEIEDMRIILVPSLNDAQHDFVYPQPPFEASKIKEMCEHSKRLHLMSNPCRFQVNDVTFGVSAVDVLFDLGSNEVYRAPTGNKQPRLVRLCQEVLNQRSFYPIFPASSPVDLSFTKYFEFEETPQVMILPSKLNRFCKPVNVSVCLNPGTLTKGAGGGTYATMTIFPDNNSITQRTYIQLKRI